MTILSDKAQKHFPFIILYLSFLIIGLFIVPDYGISWDEPACRNDMAIPNYDFILKGNYKSLESNDAKYHGPAFELLLFPLEKLFNLKDSQEIFLMRHYATFLLFAFSIIFFYRLCWFRFKSNWLATLGAALLILSPRIFADSFYNVKDLAFLSMVVINLFTTVYFLEKKNYSTAVINAIVSALVIDIRIMGIIIPVFTLFFLIMELVQSKESRKKLIKVTGLFLIILGISVVVFWPVLWHSPVKHFISAFRESSKFPWDGYVLYLGDVVKATDLPWHYIPVWFLFTTPVLYIVLFLTGIIASVKAFIAFRQLPKSDLLNLYVFFVPIVSVIILQSVLYDGWRHLYYIQPSFIFIALIGFNFLYKWFNERSTQRILITCTIAYCFYMAFVMFTLHPYQNLYFNIFAGKSLASATEKFEMDYWGLSYKEGLEHILNADSSDQILVHSSEFDPLINNIQILPKHQRDRLIPANTLELSDYFLTSYRSIRRKCVDCPDVFNVVRDNAVVLSVFNYKNEKLNFSKPGYLFLSFSNYYDSTSGSWTKTRTITDTTTNRTIVESIDSSTVFASALEFSPDMNEWNLKDHTMYLKVSLDCYSEKSYSASIVFQVDSGQAKTYIWNTYRISSSHVNKWNKHEHIVALPQLIHSGDKVKVYFCNTERENFMIDNMDVSFFRVPNSEIPNVLDRFK